MSNWFAFWRHVGDCLRASKHKSFGIKLGSAEKSNNSSIRDSCVHSQFKHARLSGHYGVRAESKEDCNYWDRKYISCKWICLKIFFIGFIQFFHVWMMICAVVILGFALNGTNVYYYILPEITMEIFSDPTLYKAILSALSKF